MDPRSINFNVLRRHDSKITSIIDSTSYVVIYRYFHGAWSKTGLEGTMFIFQRDHHLPKHGVFVLNRQGLDNMSQGLLSGWEVDLDEGLIIWRNEGATGDADDDIIHGLWIYEEQDRSRIAGVMQSLIDLSTPEPEPEPTTSSPQVSLSHPVPRIPIIPSGQSISLDQLFGVGSVCSEAPPSTSDLPHPTTSLTDSSESQSALPPQHVMSPDPSDLPKGMQLLDSLFQKASLKTQTSTSSINPDLLPQPQPQPTSIGIHQLLQTQPVSPHPLPNLNPSSSSTHPHHHPPTQDHRGNSSDENYKPQSYNELNRNQTHKAHHHHHQQQQHRASNSKSGQTQSSRHSSGGSSSHPQSEKMVAPTSNGHPGPPHYPVHPNPQFQSTQAVMVSSSEVSNDSAHAEARHNILSLLGHPIATSTSHPNNTGPISHPGTWTAPNGSPDSLRSAGAHREVYHPSIYGKNLPTKFNHQETHSNVRSQHTSQHSSPQSHPSPHPMAYPPHSQAHPSVPLQEDLGSSPTALHHPPHLSRNGSSTHHSSPHKIRGTPPKAPLPVLPLHPRSSQVGSNHLWNHEHLPKRAMSPLNPACQSQSQSQTESRSRSESESQRRRIRTGGLMMNSGEEELISGWKERNGEEEGRRMKGGKERKGAPRVNDFSRPFRTDHPVQPPPPHHHHHHQEEEEAEGGGGGVRNRMEEGEKRRQLNKMMGEVLDEGMSLKEHEIEEGRSRSRNGSRSESESRNGGGREKEALDKKEFVRGMMDLMKVSLSFFF
ncbi:hypothetical protein DFH28DRAFT_460437 [Melampsora americana]|nr:hypothetical protein DFH28DRAFT_460437 [Melampsora americana]